MVTEKQQFINYLKCRGFNVSPVLYSLPIIPNYRITPEKHHTLISNISCCLFDGVNTKTGDLGCVTFYYGGVIRHKYRRQSISAELLKKVIVPKTAKETIATFEQWHIESAEILRTWKTII